MEAGKKKKNTFLKKKTNHTKKIIDFLDSPFSQLNITCGSVSIFINTFYNKMFEFYSMDTRYVEV